MPWVLAVAVFGAGIGLMLYLGGSHGPSPGPAQAPPAPPQHRGVPPTGQAGSKRPEHYPLAQPATPRGGHQKSASAGSPKPSLPSLKHSDGPLRQGLGELLGKKAVERFLVPKRIVRRVVVSVDNLSRRQVPPRDNLAKPVPGQLRVTRRDGAIYLSRANYARYDPYVKLLTSLDVKGLVALYVRFYPLFQEQYRKLGYPHGYFNDRVVQTMDNLLATPEVKHPVKLVRPSVMYKYADPELEHLSAGQKILLRMGPKNAAKVKTMLRRIRKTLLKHVQRGG